MGKQCRQRNVCAALIFIFSFLAAFHGRRTHGKQPIFPTTQHKQKTNGSVWPDGVAAQFQTVAIRQETPGLSLHM